MEFLEFIKNNPHIPLLVFYILEKAVKKSKWKWDDILFDMILDPVFGKLKKKEK